MINIIQLKNNLSPGQKKIIRKFLKILPRFLPYVKSLPFLALIHGTSKREHKYIQYYQKYFCLIKKKKLNILEIGVGGYDDQKVGGESIRMWRDYFQKSMIYGIDIADKTYLNEKRIKIFQGNQNDPKFLKDVAERIGMLDLVIDDGSHVSEDIITSFRTLFPYLADGGIYIIEDLMSSYWFHFGGNSKDLNKSTTSMSMLKMLVDGLNYQYIPNRSATYSDRKITSIHFYPKIAFIFKGENSCAIPDYIINEMEIAKKKEIEALMEDKLNNG